jgi:hypothetical protein
VSGPVQESPVYVLHHEGRQWLLILTATLFSLLIEYSWRGLDNLVSAPLIFPALFLLYFSLFTMLEDLIVRFRLRDYHFLIMAFFYGTIYEFFLNGAAFYRPGFLDIDWIALIFMNLVIWASLHGILTFYLATRLFPRGPHAPLLSEGGWATVLVVNFIALVMIHIGENLLSPELVQLFVLFVILIVAALIFRVQAKKMEWRSSYVPFRKSTILDLVCLITVVIFLFNALMFTRDPVNLYTTIYSAAAWRTDFVWSTAVAVILLVYRVLKGESIPV